MLLIHQCILLQNFIQIHQETTENQEIYFVLLRQKSLFLDKEGAQPPMTLKSWEFSTLQRHRAQPHLPYLETLSNLRVLALKMNKILTQAGIEPWPSSKTQNLQPTH